MDLHHPATGTAGDLKLPKVPRVLNASRREELERMWGEVMRTGILCLDASEVESVDSGGLAMLVDGFDQMRRAGYRMTLADPSAPVREAREALRLEDRLPYLREPDPPPEIEPGTLLGEVLVRLGFLEEEQLQAALARSAERPGVHLGQIMIQEGFINEEHLAQALARQYGLPYVRPSAHGTLDVTLEHGVPFPELRVHGVLPFLRMDDVLAVAVSDPSDVYATDAIRNHSGLMVVTAVASPGEVQRGLDLLQRATAAKGEDTGSVLESGSVPVEEQFEEILRNALIEGASDLHLEPAEDHYILRYRVDGRLRRVSNLSLEDGSSLTARIKVLAGCDISEKRLPQDGRIHYQDGQRDVDLRVNTLPTVYGEKTVMRVLDRKGGSIPLESMGMTPANLATVQQAIREPHGLVLVTGPTGSGKTTTLYSILDEIRSPEVNISTVENPVERAIEGVNQTQVNPKAGLDFATCLRALLRQDPDVIMIGEIRDAETAEIAVEAALTGHLVLATLHTNDAPSAPVRLIQMGIEPYLVAATLRVAVAQRLVRRLCEACKEPVVIPGEVRALYARHGLGQGPHYKAAGCPVCRQSGYDKRLPVFEVLQLTEPVADMVARNPSAVDLKHRATQNGMAPLLEDAIRYVNRGVTTLEEAIRAGGSATP